MPYIGQGLQQGRRQLHTFTATASQTTFSVAYSPGYVDVYQNGILLAPSDYTATNGTTVVLAVGAAVNDEITIIAQHLFSVADVVSASQGGTFTGDVTMTGNLTVQGTTISVDTSTAQTLAMGDADKISLGDNADLQIYHEPTYNNGIIVESGSGNLLLGGNHINLRDSTLTTTMANFNPNNSADLYYAGTKVFGTTATGIDIANGTGTIFNNSGTFTIDANTNLTLRGGIHTFDNADGSVEYARITSSGNVGIGTTGPNTKLHVKSGGAGNAYGSLYLEVDTATNYPAMVIQTSTGGNFTETHGLYINNTANGFGLRIDDDTSDTTPFVVDSSGKVGIGTTSPASPLSVQADGIGIRLDGTANTTRSLFFRNTTTSNPAQIFSDGSLRLRTEDASTAIIFNTNSTGTNNEAMRITGSQNVGIGETSPDCKLHVRGGASGGGRILIQTDGAFAGTDEAMLDFRHYDDTGDPSGRISLLGTTNYTGDMVFKVRSGGTSGGGGAGLQEKMRVTGDSGLKVTSDTGNSSTQDNISIIYNGTAGGHTSGLLFRDKRDAVNAAIKNVLQDDGVGTAAAHLRFQTSHAGTLTTQMTIDRYGQVMTPNQPSFRAYTTSDYTANGVLESANWTVQHDNNGDFSNGRFTAPVDGVYHFDVYWDSYQSLGGLNLLINTSSYYVKWEPTGNTNNGWETKHYATKIKLSSGDYVRLVGVHASGSNPFHMGSGHWGFFAGHLLG